MSGTIKSVQARTIKVPLANPIAFSTRRIDARHYTLVRIECSDGTVGRGFCHGGTSYGGLATDAIRHLFRSRLIGQDPHCTEAIWQDLYQDSLLNGRAGAVMRALSAVDVALWDRNARSVGLPLWRYMGSYQRETVPAYGSGGYYVAGGPDEVREEIARHMAAGFTAVKIKVGGASPADDAIRVAAAREVLGPDGKLLLDANNAWKDLPSALDALTPLLPYRPFLIEEPFGPEDVANHRRLADALPITVATGEIAAGRYSMSELIQRGGVTLLQPDVAVCGGITEWRRIAAMAASLGVPVASHSFHHLNVHLIASTPNGMFVEYFPDHSIMPFGRVVDRELDVRNGELVLPRGPGLGFDFDRGALKEFAIDDWA